MLKSRLHVVVLVALLLAGAARSPAQTVAAREDQGKLIAVLKSNDASRKDKADACRQLAIIGTTDAIAPLAALLADEELSHMARYALEPLPGPAVDQVFRDALGRLQGKPLVGVIGSIGVRRDAKAVEPLKAMLMKHDAGGEVTGAIVRALGSIGNPAAADVLKTALDHAPSDGQLALYEGAFRCAERLAAEGRRDEAIGLYDALRELDAPHQVRAGALRGAILARGRNGLSLLREYLKSDDYILFSAAVQTAQEMPGRRVTQALTADLNEMPADHRIVIIKTLSLRGDRRAPPVLFAAAKSGPAPVRVAAIEAVAEMGQASAVGVLVELIDDSDRGVSLAAKEALGALPLKEADAAVTAMFKTGQADKQVTALGLMGRRRMTGSVPTLLRAARAGNADVRPGVIKMVGELGGPDQVASLLELLSGLERPEDLAAAEQALAAVCTKSDDPQSHSAALIRALNRGKSAQKTVLVRVLGSVSGPEALKAVRAAVDSDDADVRMAAIRALGTWKTADAAPLLLTLAKETGDQNEKTLFLRRYLAMAGRRDLPAGQRLSMCRQVADMVRRDDERRMLLAALGNIDLPEAMTLIVGYLDSGTRQEAVMAALRVAQDLLKRRDASKYAAKLIEPLEKVTQADTNEALNKRARALLRQARNRAGN